MRSAKQDCKDQETPSWTNNKGRSGENLDGVIKLDDDDLI